MLPNQIRYIHIITGVLLLIAVQRSNPKLYLNPYAWIIIMSLGIMLKNSAINQYPNPLNLPKDSKIICDNMDAMYAVIFSNKQKIGQITPPMEIGYANKKYLEAIKHKRIEDCETLKNYDYLVEKSITKTPECAVFYIPYGQWRIWKISLQPIQKF